MIDYIQKIATLVESINRQVFEMGTAGDWPFKLSTNGIDVWIELGGHEVWSDDDEIGEETEDSPFMSLLNEHLWAVVRRRL